MLNLSYGWILIVIIIIRHTIRCMRVRKYDVRQHTSLNPTQTRSNALQPNSSKACATASINVLLQTRTNCDVLAQFCNLHYTVLPMQQFVVELVPIHINVHYILTNSVHASLLIIRFHFRPLERADIKKQFSVMPQSVHVEVGARSEIRCSAPEGLPLPTLQWLKNGVPLVSDTSVLVTAEGSVLITHASMQVSATFPSSSKMTNYSAHVSIDCERCWRKIPKLDGGNVASRCDKLYSLFRHQKNSIRRHSTNTTETIIIRCRTCPTIRAWRKILPAKGCPSPSVSPFTVSNFARCFRRNWFRFRDSFHNGPRASCHSVIAKLYMCGFRHDVCLMHSITWNSVNESMKSI